MHKTDSFGGIDQYRGGRRPDFYTKTTDETLAASYLYKGLLLFFGVVERAICWDDGFICYVGLPWRTHVARISQGLGFYSLTTVLIESGITTSA